MIRISLVVVALSPAAFPQPPRRASHIRARFPSIFRLFASDAKRSGIGQRGLQALASTQLSGITWRFESIPKAKAERCRAILQHFWLSVVDRVRMPSSVRQTNAFSRMQSSSRRLRSSLVYQVQF